MLVHRKDSDLKVVKSYTVLYVNVLYCMCSNCDCNFFSQIK